MKKVSAEEVVKIEDQRFYLFGEDVGYVPSVTTILQYTYKGLHLMKWIAEHGWDESQVLKNVAAERGTNVHNGMELLTEGKEILFRNFTEAEWKHLMSGKQFLEDYSCETVSTEHTILSTKLKAKVEIMGEEKVYDIKYAGTIDWEGWVTVKGEKKYVRADWKTSKNIFEEHKIQLVMYELAEREQGKKPADELWVIKTGAGTKKGYSLTKIDMTKIPEYVAQFFDAYRHWMTDNPNAKPWNREYPTSLQLGTNK